MLGLQIVGGKLWRLELTEPDKAAPDNENSDNTQAVEDDREDRNVKWSTLYASIFIHKGTK
jgi:hypothetical protein